MIIECLTWDARSMCCAFGQHVWLYSGDLRPWPSMRCACGARRWDQANDEPIVRPEWWHPMRANAQFVEEA